LDRDKSKNGKFLHGDMSRDNLKNDKLSHGELSHDELSRDKLPLCHFLNSESPFKISRTQSYDFDLQRLRCKNLQLQRCKNYVQLQRCKNLQRN
jgi:hypothetical protein